MYTETVKSWARFSSNSKNCNVFFIIFYSAQNVYVS